MKIINRDSEERNKEHRLLSNYRWKLYETLWVVLHWCGPATWLECLNVYSSHSGMRFSTRELAIMCSDNVLAFYSHYSQPPLTEGSMTE
jgi:hypothetical protein